MNVVRILLGILIGLVFFGVAPQLAGVFLIAYLGWRAGNRLTETRKRVEQERDDYAAFKAWKRNQ